MDGWMDGWRWMGRDGTGRDGMGWDGMGWDGMGWDGMGWDGMGWIDSYLCLGVGEFSIYQIAVDASNYTQLTWSTVSAISISKYDKEQEKRRKGEDGR
jgi:hypothetical protein